MGTIKLPVEPADIFFFLAGGEWAEPLPPGPSSSFSSFHSKSLLLLRPSSGESQEVAVCCVASGSLGETGFTEATSVLMGSAGGADFLAVALGVDSSFSSSMVTLID